MSKSGPVWIKAERSVDQGACIELAAIGHHIALRDSKNPDVLLHFTTLEMATFFDGVKNGEFDHLVGPASPEQRTRTT